jgi:nucleotide-binding universal stress UspA family protein
MKKQRIVLPTDFSENAWHAMKYALTIFRDVPCDFFIVNAFQVGSSGLSTKMGMANDTRLFQLMKEESERELKRVMERIHGRGNNNKHSFKTLSVADTLVNAIGKTVYNQGVDYIVMGTKGASGVREVFLGSNTYKIIKEIDFCPILAVPDDYEIKPSIDAILLATGYEHPFETYELKPILKLAKQFGSNIKIVHVGVEDGLNTKQLESKAALEKELKSATHQFVDVAPGMTVNAALQQLIESDDSIQLIAMINHDHTFFERLTREPVIKKIAFNTKVPFLVIHLFE